ncbi:MAG: hypothetical protein V3V47_01900 [Desulfobacteria bacterium]
MKDRNKLAAKGFMLLAIVALLISVTASIPIYAQVFGKISGTDEVGELGPLYEISLTYQWEVVIEPPVWTNGNVKNSMSVFEEGETPVGTELTFIEFDQSLMEWSMERVMIVDTNVMDFTLFVGDSELPPKRLVFSIIEDRPEGWNLTNTITLSGITNAVFEIVDGDTVITWGKNHD